ncbi:TIGR03491, putative RecB family nuclease, TM0106 family [Candidatus Nanopelagicaceae bacterium]
MKSLRLDSRSAIYCHEYLHKKYAPNAFPGLTPDAPDPVVEEFKKLGFSHENKAIVALKEVIPNLIEINQDLPFSEIELETVRALLDPNAFAIAGAYISENVEKELAKAFDVEFKASERSSRPDLIIRIGTKSDGHPIWAPVDIKSHKAISDSKANFVFSSQISDILPSQDTRSQGRLDYNDLHQLAHYTRHFQALGIAGDDLWVGIIGRDLENCIWARIGDVVMGQGQAQESFLSAYDQQFAEAREVVRLSQIENDDLSKKAGVIPVNSSGKMGCTVCKYKSTCLKEMEAFDNGHGHVTLLARITPLTVEKHFPHIASINDLLVETPLNDQMVTARIRARVKKTEVPELLDPSTPFELPEADIEIDIDLENSMETLRELEIDEPIGEDRLYLYGFGIHDRAVSKDWRTAVIDTYFDYSNTEDGEFDVMSKMWNKLNQEISKAENSSQSIKIFHYSPHEFTWWKKYANRFLGRPGVPTLNELEEFKINYLVDLYPYAQKWAFPVKSYSIKDLAPLAKFEWSVELAGGANSLFKYRDAINKDLDQSVRDEAIAWLDAYNRDDVRATFAVRNYIRSLA